MSVFSEKPMLSHEKSGEGGDSCSGDAIVISGISGVFPASNNVMELMSNLNNKVDLVSKSLHEGCGRIDGITKFDAPFFRVPYKQAMVLDPISRMLLEQTYGAIFDAGVNPMTLKGRKVGVFIGSSYSDNNALYTVNNKNKYWITGNGSKSMYANRISYWIDSKGPSYNIDSTCSSSMVCLHEALISINRGECESAVVGGANLCISPTLTRNIESAGLCLINGKSTGSHRSEVINVIYLQKLKDAKRIYAEIYFTQIGYNLKSDDHFSSVRKFVDIEKVLTDFYAKANVSPEEVEYIEIHGLAETNNAESQAIRKLFNTNKSILIGNVKNFMGNTEAASGICAVTKICLAYHSGQIAIESCPVEFECSSTKKSSEIFCKHSQEIKKFNRGLVAINNYSFGGSDAHVLLKCHYKGKKMEDRKIILPSLVFTSGRNEDCVNKFFEVFKKEPLDAERIALLHDIHKTDIPGHTYRGYIMLEKEKDGKNTTLAQSVQLHSGKKRQLWFVYSGMGSQWPEMGLALLRIPTFAAAIDRCRKALEPKGVDLINLLTNPDRHLFNNILNSFVGIAAVQIGLTDILYEMDIVPDFIIGHSVGELGCGYADGCLTAEEMILAAYHRGLVSIQTNFIHGSMAAIGLGHREVQRLCPPEIEIACHNSPTSSTISGPSDVMKKFVKQLKLQGIFAKEVQVSNIAYHSKYIEIAGPALLRHLHKVIKTPKLRSKKWICTSLPVEKWNEPAALYCSAEYHTNNLLNPVYFEESAKLIPSDAIIVEIAPHGLLQAILKRSHPNCFNISLTKKINTNPVKYILEGIGKLYQEGCNPKVDVLYPKIKYPVSTETSLLSHLVHWDHRENWQVAKPEKEKVKMPAHDFLLSAHDKKYKFLEGYVRNGKNVLPEAAVLFFVWETLAKFHGINVDDLSVIFKDVEFFNEVIMSNYHPLKLSITINKETGLFEICNNDKNIANGTIHFNENKKSAEIQCNVIKKIPEGTITLETDDIYKVFHYRGFKFRNEFKSIVSIDTKNETALVKWTENWITIIDSIIQLKTFKMDHKGVTVPKFISELIVDTNLHKTAEIIDKNDIHSYVAEFFSSKLASVCAGVIIKNIIFKDIPVNDPSADIIEKVAYFSHGDKQIQDINICLKIITQIVIDNVSDTDISVATTLSKTAPLILRIKAVFKDSVLINDTSIEYDIEHKTYNEKIKIAHLVVAEGMLNTNKKYKILEQVIGNETFIVTIEYSEPDSKKIKDYDVISRMLLDEQIIFLLRNKIEEKQSKKVCIKVDHENTFEWVDWANEELQKCNEVILISERESHCGLLGVVRNLDRQYKNKIRLCILDDYHAPAFSLENKIFEKQLYKNLNINVFKQGKWGGYYSLPIQSTSNASDNFGDINSLTWTDLQTDNARGNIQVHFAGLSSRDCLKVNGIFKYEPEKFGMEYSGIDHKGNKVMGLINASAVSIVIEADTELVWPVPKYWSMEDAATVPLAYVYAYYCLMIKGELRYGQTVFVNAGTGAMGQAVISICSALNCTVFTTVGDDHEKEFLLRLFPQLKANNILDSRDPSFYLNLMLMNEKRCDFVISSEKGILREAAMKCVASLGIFFNINDSDDLDSNEDFGMFYLDEDRNYKNVDITSLFQPQNLVQRKILNRAVTEGISNGTVRPLSRILYCNADVHKAFKLIASRKSRGRVLIKMKDDEQNQVKVSPRISLTLKGVYIIISDKNQLGIELADYLVQQGAETIIIHQKSKFINGYIQYKIQTWQKLNVETKIITSELKTKEDCLNIIKEGTILGIITGIFIIQNKTDDGKTAQSFGKNDFEEKFKETASVVFYLDDLSRSYCTKLSAFVIITRSSTNLADHYVASVCENVCESRKDAGLPGLALRAHLIDEYANQNKNKTKMEPQSIQTLFKTMTMCLKFKSSNVHTFNIKQTKQSDDEYLYKHEHKYRTTESIKTLYEFNEKDEVMANEPVVRMQTMLGDCEEPTSLDSDSCIMLIPGFEGNHNIFESLCKSLKINAVTLQLGPDLIKDSIAKLALSLRESMKKCHIEPKSKFYILGYSFGVNVAFELAAILEKEGLRGTIFCLDHTPDSLKKELNSFLGPLTEEELQDFILNNIQKAMTQKSNENLTEKYYDVKNWSEKVELFALNFRGSGYSMQFTKAVLNSAYSRLKIALNWNSNIKLQSKLILIKRNSVELNESNNETHVNNILSRFATEHDIVNINSEYTSVLYCSETPHIVNSYLDAEVMEKYEKHDFCVTYSVL